MAMGGWRPCATAGGCRAKQWMRRVFGSFGAWVSANATAVIVAMVAIVPVSSLGMLRFEPEQNVQLDFAPVGARALVEQRAMSHFYSSGGYLYHFTAPIFARDGGSLLRPGHKAALEAAVRHIEHGIGAPVAAPVRNGTGGEVRQLTYMQMCRSTCELNKAAMLMLYFYEHNGTNDSPAYRAGYPNVRLHTGHELYIADHVYDVRLDERGLIESVGIFKVLLRTAVPRGPLVDGLKRFEERVADYMERVHANDSHLLDMAHGGHHMTGIKALEVATRTIPFIPIGLLLTTSFTMFASARFGRQSDTGDSKPYTAAIGVLAPLMATAVACGLLTGLGHKYKAYLASAPFLILAVGVDDIFIVLHSWRKSDKRLPPAERMRQAMSDAGPTITLTSLTNVISMLCGIVNTTPAISQFCTWTATGVVVNWLYQVLFFTAVLHHSAGLEATDWFAALRRRSLTRKQPAVGTHTVAPIDVSAVDTLPAPTAAQACTAHALRWRLLRAYCRFACTWRARLLVAATLAVYLAGAGYGLGWRLRPNLSQDKVAPRDSLMGVWGRFLDEHEYREAATVFVLVDRPPDLTVDAERETMQRLVADFEHDAAASGGEHAMGPESTHFWLRDYYDFMQFHDFFRRNASFTYRLMPAFLETPPYTRWQYSVHTRPALCAANSAHCVSGYVFSTGFKNAVSWADRQRLLAHWRRLVDSYAQYGATVYEDVALYSDQMQIIVPSTAFSVLCGLAAMALVCCVFIASFWPVVAAVAALTSIVFGMVGYMPYFGFDLDPMTVCLVVAMVGYSVDFAAHIPYHYYKDTTARCTADRIESSLLSIGGPMLQAGVTTVLVIPGLYFVNAYVTDAVLYMQPFTVLSGLYHGLLVLPTVLAALAPVKGGGG